MLIDYYITFMPVIFMGIFNMLFTKTKLYKNNRKPIDCGKKLKDAQFIFGENKTWIGFFSMIIFGILSQELWGTFNTIFNIENKNFIFSTINNNWINNIWIGALYGFAYVICELPNSFIKRRLKIPPGKSLKGNWIGKVFFIVDQIDSIIGIMLVLAIFYKMSLVKYLLFVLIGGVTHIVINLILYILKIRKDL